MEKNFSWGSRNYCPSAQLCLFEGSPCPSSTLGRVWGWMGSKLAESWWGSTGI